MGLTSDRHDKCSVLACSGLAYARTWCAKHYARRWRRRTTDPAFGRPSRPRAEGCLVPGCESTHKGRGFCQKHLNRRRKGLPLLGPIKTLNPKRYRVVTRRGHQIAMRNGRVYEHRLVLFDAVRGASLPCFWCGEPVHWLAETSEQALHVDHLDHDRHNNQVTNLRPSCPSCNCGRMRPGQRRPVYT